MLSRHANVGHSPPVRSSHTAVWAPCDGCGSVPLCRRVEFAPGAQCQKRQGYTRANGGFKLPPTARVHTRTQSRVPVRVHSCSGVYTRTRARTHTHLHTRVCAHASMHTRTHARAREHTHARTHARTHTVARTPTRVSKHAGKIVRTPTPAITPAPHTHMIKHTRLNR
jgi:hypothetical protein